VERKNQSVFDEERMRHRDKHHALGTIHVHENGWGLESHHRRSYGKLQPQIRKPAPRQLLVRLAYADE